MKLEIGEKINQVQSGVKIEEVEGKQHLFIYLVSTKITIYCVKHWKNM